MIFGRKSGVLLHPTSLPGPFGIGDLGPEAYRFVNFLVKGGQRLWQILPLGPTGFGNSPYMCYSAFAGNPYMVSPERLLDQGWLQPRDWESLPEWETIQDAFLGRVNFAAVMPFKEKLLRRAWEGFQEHANPEHWQSFRNFCQQESRWLNDYALFMTLKYVHDHGEWVSWDPPLAHRDPEALSEAEAKYSEQVTEHKFYQFLFWQQWLDLKSYANRHQIHIMGDMPIYVAHNSAEVWANSELFFLEPDGRPALVAGVPPDYFSPTGQRWGNPLYNWSVMQERGYIWWIDRMQSMLNQVDSVRIDHFRGFESYWAIPGDADTAVQGEWKQGPGSDLFVALQQKLGQIPVAAEDLGDITPAVLDLRDRFNFPGMKVLLFAFGSGADNPYLPHNFDRNCVVYTGTHDNNTTVGWFYGGRISEAERQGVLDYLGQVSPAGIQWDMIRLALQSVANLAVIPLQDIFGLGEDSRMNLPGTMEQNWGWRYSAEMLHDGLAHQLADLTVTFGRISPAELDAGRHHLG